MRPCPTPTFRQCICYQSSFHTHALFACIPELDLLLVIEPQGTFSKSPNTIQNGKAVKPVVGSLFLPPKRTPTPNVCARSFFRAREKKGAPLEEDVELEGGPDVGLAGGVQNLDLENMINNY